MLRRSRNQYDHAGGKARSPVGIIRRIGRRDTDALKAHFHGLSAQDRRARFFAQISDAGLDAYVERTNKRQNVLIGYFIATQLVGLVEMVPAISRWHRYGEIAVSVSEPWRGQGISAALIARAQHEAAARGLRRLRLIILPENDAMRRVMIKLGARLNAAGDVITAHLSVPAPPETPGLWSRILLSLSLGWLGGARSVT